MTSVSPSAPPLPSPALPPPTDPPTAQNPPPPGPPPTPQRPPLRRSRDNKVISGVSGGLADYTGIDALLWRVAFIALTFAGGTGVLVYLLLWLLMPAGPVDPNAPVRAARRSLEPRSPVPGVTVAAVLIVVGVLVLLTRFTALELGPRGFLGAALLVVGIGLVVAAFTGGRTAKGGLIALGVVLSFALAAASAVPWDRGPAGDRLYVPGTVADVDPVYPSTVGDLTLDLSEVPLSGLDEPIATRVEHGFGDVEIILPASADVLIDIDSGLGSVDVFDGSGETGGIYPGRGSSAWTGDDQAEFELTIDAGVGDVTVSRG